MKAQKVQVKQEFKPFRLIIDIENENEAKELWCRFNASVDSIKDCNVDYESKTDFQYDNNTELFDILDEALRGL